VAAFPVKVFGIKIVHPESRIVQRKRFIDLVSTFDILTFSKFCFYSYGLSIDTAQFLGDKCMKLYYCESCEHVLSRKISAVQHKLFHLTHKVKEAKYDGT